MEIQRRKLLASSLTLGLALAITGMPIHFDPDSHALKAGYDPAFAKDDDSHDDDSDDDDGGDDDGSDHDSNDDHGGDDGHDDDSNDDRGGDDDGPDHDSNDDRNSRSSSSSRSSRSSSSNYSQSDRTGRVARAQRRGGNIEVRFVDGWKEEVENGRYELKDPAGRTVVERAATNADVSRLSLAFR